MTDPHKNKLLNILSLKIIYVIIGQIFSSNHLTLMIKRQLLKNLSLLFSCVIEIRLSCLKINHDQSEESKILAFELSPSQPHTL